MKNALEAKLLLRSTLKMVGPSQREVRFLQLAFERALSDGGFNPVRPSLRGREPDVTCIIRDTEPALLVEVKPTGQWDDVGMAAAQLLVHGSRLRDAAKVAVFGTPVQYPSLKEMLTLLGIEFIEP